MAIAVRRSPIHASRFARVFFSDASALRLRVGIQIKPKRTRGETSGTVAERASRRGFARRGLPPVRACALCIGRRRRKPWEFIPFQSLRLANSKFGSGQANFGKKNPKKKNHTPVYVGSSSVAMYAFGFQECTTKLFGSPDSDASPHLSLALAFPLPASADRRPLRSPTRGAG